MHPNPHREIVHQQNNIPQILMHIDDENVIASVKEEVRSFMKQFPLYPGLTVAV